MGDTVTLCSTITASGTLFVTMVGLDESRTMMSFASSCSVSMLSMVRDIQVVQRLTTTQPIFSQSPTAVGLSLITFSALAARPASTQDVLNTPPTASTSTIAVDMKTYGLYAREPIFNLGMSDILQLMNHDQTRTS